MFELFMHVRNGRPNGAVTFSTESSGAVWDREGQITDVPEYIHSADLEVPLDSKGPHENDWYGWDRYGQSSSESKPCLGRGWYEISVPGDGEILRLDYYGVQLKGDAVVTYYASGDSSAFGKVVGGLARSTSMMA